MFHPSALSDVRNEQASVFLQTLPNWLGHLEVELIRSAGEVLSVGVFDKHKLWFSVLLYSA